MVRRIDAFIKGSSSFDGMKRPDMAGFNFIFSENDVKEFGENTDPIKVTKDGKTYCKVLQGNGYRNNMTLAHQNLPVPNPKSN